VRYRRTRERMTQLPRLLTAIIRFPLVCTIIKSRTGGQPTDVSRRRQLPACARVHVGAFFLHRRYRPWCVVRLMEILFSKVSTK
jgi:hypothetical protein